MVSSQPDTEEGLSAMRRSASLLHKRAVSIIFSAS